MVSWLPLNIWGPLFSFPFQPFCYHFATLVSPSLWSRMLSRTGDLLTWDLLMGPTPSYHFLLPFQFSLHSIQHCSLFSLLLLILHPSAICVHYPIPEVQDPFLSPLLSNLVEKQSFSLLTLPYRVSTCSAFLPTSPEHSDWTTRGQSSFSSTGSRLERS